MKNTFIRIFLSTCISLIVFGTMILISEYINYKILFIATVITAITFFVALSIKKIP